MTFFRTGVLALALAMPLIITTGSASFAQDAAKTEATDAAKPMGPGAKRKTLGVELKAIQAQLKPAVEELKKLRGEMKADGLEADARKALKEKYDAAVKAVADLKASMKAKREEMAALKKEIADKKAG